MKISEMSAMSRLPNRSPVVERREAGQRNFTFKGEIQNINERNAMERLAEMGENIIQQGLVTARRCDILELKRYKEMIAEYMNAIVEFAFAFRKQSLLDARGRHKMYATIKRVNQKLEEMTKQMLAGQTQNLDIMQAVDEIRGMLIDLLL